MEKEEQKTLKRTVVILSAALAITSVFAISLAIRVWGMENTMIIFTDPASGRVLPIELFKNLK